MVAHFDLPWFGVLDSSFQEWINRYIDLIGCLSPASSTLLRTSITQLKGDKYKVIHNVDIVEGKYKPIVMGKKEFGEKGATAGLVVRVTKESGLCVLEGLVSMVDKGVLGLALIKNRR